MSVYTPLSSGLPSYFLPMLNDTSRNALYKASITSTISSFIRSRGRRPRVLDLGCGTGLLSSYALDAGASHVTAVDVNSTMCLLARRSLAGYPRSSYEVVCGCIKPGATRGCYKPDEKFDVLVTEILGTVATSESMYEHTALCVPYLNVFEGGEVYVIPQRLEVTVRLYDFKEIMEVGEEAVETAYEGVLPVPGEDGEVTIYTLRPA